MILSFGNDTYLVTVNTALDLVLSLRFMPWVRLDGGSAGKGCCNSISKSW